ncbi:MAG: sulfurtransferase [Bradyrhizobiaceae bacterium]|nr:sulfurtransferase [Bradyrhizobiaceae bacterium]
MPPEIAPSTLKSWLSDGAEIALFDVREHGQYGCGHAFFAVPLPYSRFETGLPALAPNPAVRLVLCDGGDGVAARVAVRAATLGYRNVAVLAGGAPAWRQAGYTLYEGVNVPSKTFGEIVEQQRHTPRVTAQRVAAMQAAGEDFVIVDGRPFAEYTRMNIPGSVCCPNGELALRIADIAPDPATKIVVNCAGRTRSIIGAQTLIDIGVPNEVFALENGTQGWLLAGLALEHGASRRYPEETAPGDAEALRRRARRFAEANGAAFVAPGEAEDWLADGTRTTFLFDVRTEGEFAGSGISGFAHAPGGQLIQATDQWVGVKGARIIVIDREEVRAPVVAGWLRQLGHDAFVLDGGTAAAAAHRFRRVIPAPADLVQLEPVSVAEAAEGLRRGAVRLLDLRAGMSYRRGHIAGATWTIRPRIVKDLGAAGAARAVVLVADDPDIATLAAIDLRASGAREIGILAGGFEAWRSAGLPVAVTPGQPADAECIDFLFFTHDRHSNPDAARRYLAWETSLPEALDAQELGVFRPMRDA